MDREKTRRFKGVRRLERAAPQLLGVLLTLLFVGLYGGAGGLLDNLRDRLEWIGYDLRAQWVPFAAESPDAPIVIVEIDDESLQRIGRWPWPRAQVAELIQAIQRGESAVVAMDMIFAEDEKSPLDDVGQLLAEHGMALDADRASVLTELADELDGDSRLARVLADSPVVLGFSVGFDDGASQGALPEPLPGFSQNGIRSLSLPPFSRFTGNTPALQLPGGLGGTISVRPDADGVIRSVPLLFSDGNNVYGSLALESVMQYFGIREAVLDTAEVDDGVILEGLSVAGLVRVPTDSHGQLLIPYRKGEGWLQRISAADLLEGRADPALLKDAIVLVGTTAAGLHDLRATPVGSLLPGILIQANVVAGLLDGRAPHASSWMTGADISVLLLLGIFLAFLMPRLKPFNLALTTLVTLAALIAVVFWAWRAYGFVFSIALPVLMVISLAVLNFAWGFWREQRSRYHLRNVFGQYVPATHIDRIIDNPDASATLDGEKRDMTVLFADIRSFTTLSEGMDADELKRFLEFYFTPLTEVIFNNGGTIDKYVGDMIMAFWGAPLSDADHRKHGLTAALEMLEASAGLTPALHERGWSEVRIGVGLNSGPMNVGDMGSRYRRNYTVIGDAVNLASRIEGLTKHYGLPLLVSESTASGLEDEFLFRTIDRVRVKGKTAPVTVFQPMCSAKAANDLLRARAKIFDNAAMAYFAGNWQAAAELYTKAGEQAEDRALCDIFLERIAAMQRSPSTETAWDGAYSHQEK